MHLLSLQTLDGQTHTHAYTYILIIILLLYGGLYSTLFFLGCSKELYTENKGTFIKYADPIQIQLQVS